MRAAGSDVPGAGSHAAHRWVRQTALIADLAVISAGRAGVAVLSLLGMWVSGTMVLRVLMAMPVPAGPAGADRAQCG